MTLNNNANPLRGGTVTVDSQTIIVPDNMIVTLPGINVAWPELFNGNTPNLPLFGTVSWDINVSRTFLRFVFYKRQLIGFYSCTGFRQRRQWSICLGYHLYHPERSPDSSRVHHVNRLHHWSLYSATERNYQCFQRRDQ